MCRQRSGTQEFFHSVLNRSFSVWRVVLVVGALIGSLGLTAVTYGKSENFTTTDGTSYLQTATKSFKIFNRASHGENVKSETFFNGNARVGENYCKIEHCETVTCSNIPESFHPGELATLFIASTFKPLCTTSQSLNLIIRNSKFPSNKLLKNWLQTNVSISKLEINTCSLTEISDDAFSQSIFEEVKRIALINNRIPSLRRAMFTSFLKLQEFVVEENTIVEAEENLLQDVTNSLQMLTLNTVITDTKVLRNITGKETLKKLQVLSLRSNTIPTIDPEMFHGASEISSLYLDSSSVTNVESNTFRSMARSLQQLFMDKNNISFLPAGTFDHVVRTNPNFRVTMAGNPWHCDCSLKWLKEFVEKYPAVINAVPICQSPDYNAHLNLLQANFCQESTEEITVISSTVGSTTSTNADKDSDVGNKDPPETSKDIVKISCTDSNGSDLEQKDSSSTDIKFLTRSLFESNDFPGRFTRRKLLFSENYEFPRIFKNFSAVDLEDGTVLVTLPRETIGLALLWFDNSLLNSRTDNNHSVNTIKCAKDLQEKFLLKDIESGNSYSICLINAEERNVSPLNCLALTASPKYEARPWLLNEDKTITISTFMLLLLMMCSLSAFAMYVTVRNHPTLLRGSKRVVIVKHRKLDTLVLPKNMQNNLMTDKEMCSISYSDSKLKEDGYVSPLPICKNSFEASPTRTLCRNDSRLSRTSVHSISNSYISGIEPTCSQLMAWRLERMKNEIKQDDIELQNLPPACKDICEIKSGKLDDSAFFEENDDEPCKNTVLDNISMADPMDREDVYVMPSTGTCHGKGSTFNGLYRKDSRASTMSLHSFANSYISVVEPIIPQFPSCKFFRMKSETKSRDIEPPPLPPSNSKQCCTSSKYLMGETINSSIPEEPFNV